MKIERKKSENKLNKEMQDIVLKNQRLEFKNEALIKINDNLRERVKEEINKNKSLIEINHNLKKMIDNCKGK